MVTNKHDRLMCMMHPAMKMQTDLCELMGCREIIDMLCFGARINTGNPKCLLCVHHLSTSCMRLASTKIHNPNFIPSMIEAQNDDVKIMVTLDHNTHVRLHTEPLVGENISNLNSSEANHDNHLLVFECYRAGKFHVLLNFNNFVSCHTCVAEILNSYLVLLLK